MPTKTKNPDTPSAAEKFRADLKTRPTTTTFMPEVPLGEITKHPNNPRHRAAADQEMVDSIKAHGLLQPVVLAPHPTLAGKYTLIAGHRRLDGSRKAGRKTVPAILRTDLIDEGPQLEAMLIENGRRSDLTAIEEAEGYEQLGLFGYTQTAIAAAVGRDVKTVRSRLKLLKLSSSTRKKVHGGQLRIDDAIQLASFADDPEATKRLEKIAVKGEDLKHQLKREEQRRKALQACAEKVARLVDAGATEVPNPKKDGSKPYTFDYPEGIASIGATFSADWADHPHCLGYTMYAGDYATTYWIREAEVIELCTNPGSHDAEQNALDEGLDAEAAAARKEREAAEAQRIAEQKARIEAGQVRVDTVVDLVEGNQLPPALHDIARHLLPTLVRDLDTVEVGIYFDALDIPDTDRWNTSDLLYYADGARGRKALTLFTQHASDIADASSTQMTKYFAAVLAAAAENNLARRGAHNQDQESARDYLTLLEAIGHPFSELDIELRDQVTETSKDADQ